MTGNGSKELEKRDPNERPADRKVQRSKEKFNRAFKWILIIGLIILGGVIYTLVFRGVNQADTCQAIRKNDIIFRKLLIHGRAVSLKQVQGGVTNKVTTEKQIKGFYNPALKELAEINCG